MNELQQKCNGCGGLHCLWLQDGISIEHHGLCTRCKENKDSEDEYFKTHPVRKIIHSLCNLLFSPPAIIAPGLGE